MKLWWLVVVVAIAGIVAFCAAYWPIRVATIEAYVGSARWLAIVGIAAGVSVVCAILAHLTRRRAS